MSIYPLYGRGAISMGTTLVAAEFDGGVVMAADSRTSSFMVVQRASDKITPVVDGRIYCCRSGLSADTQTVGDAAKHHLNIYRLEHNNDPSVHIAAHVLGDMCYRYRDNLSAGFIIAGWDENKGGQVYTVPQGGMVTRMPFASDGSGSVFICGLLDSHYKGTPAGKSTMSREECEDLLRRAIVHAIARDGSSGGVVRMVVVTKNGADCSVYHPESFPQIYS